MIRKIKMSDQQAYLKMAAEFYNSEAVSHSVPIINLQKGFEHMVNDGRYFDGYIIEHNDQPAGFCAVAKTYSQEAGGMVIWIEDFYIRPEFRSNGLGAECLSFIENEFKGTAARFRLEITEDNIGAKKLYERFGFEQCPYVPMIKEIITRKDTAL